MARTKGRGPKKQFRRQIPNPIDPEDLPRDDPSKLDRIPVSYQQINDYFEKYQGTPLHLLRLETFRRIEQNTKRPVISYTSKTNNILRDANIPAYIEDADLVGFRDLINSVEGDAVDIFLISNGGSVEAAERIVRMLRERFSSIRFLISGNAYSAGTLICFSGNKIIMEMGGTLGPIDPQINGIPARAILRGFEELEERVRKEGPSVLTAFVPLIEKYDLHILEICKSAQDLSKELAERWLSTYMFDCPPEDERVQNLVKHFSDYDLHKSHGRSIDRGKARELGLNIIFGEELEPVGELIRSLANQYELMYDKSPFYKMYENAYGVNWGRLIKTREIKFEPVKQK